MNHRFFIGLSILGSALLPSCYVFEERRGQPDLPPQQITEETVTSQSQQQVQAQRDRMKEREKKKEDTTASSSPSTTEKTEEAPKESSPKPAANQKREFKYAVPVPGKPGLVFSPFNNKVIDVSDMPSGQLVRDPTYPDSEEKYFRVP